MSFGNMHHRINLMKGATGIFLSRRQSESPDMSCEGCSMRFTVFKRKKQCGICLRYYCGTCLSTQFSASGTVLSRFTERKQICSKCLILTARPLCRSKLQQLRIKDLQVYLRSQRICTRGCVEKDDLVNLLLQHVASSSNGSGGSRDIDPAGFQSQTDLSGDQQSSVHQQDTGSRSENSRLSSVPQFSPSAAVNGSGSNHSDDANSSSSAAQSQATSSDPIIESARFVSHGLDEAGDFEIVEMTDWDGAGEGSEQGPVPVVEETSEGSISDSSSVTSMEDIGESNVAACTGISLDDIDSIEELDKLSVKQIKELLSLNRVDFHGCCEKAELMARARRLWQEYFQSRKEVETMSPGELCKICMDAPIECVMLECGHMATCMACGKQLSECPICRQYVVRVVRTFRA